MNLLVDSQPTVNPYPLVDKDHHFLLTHKIELNINTCITLWNVHGIGLYDQQMLFDSPNEQSREITNVISEPAQLDEQLGDILDMVDLETAIRFLREDAKNDTETCEVKGTLELPVNVLSASDPGFLDLKKELVAKTTGSSTKGITSAATCLNMLFVDYNLPSSKFSASLEAHPKASEAELVIALISHMDSHEQVTPFSDANEFFGKEETIGR